MHSCPQCICWIIVVDHRSQCFWHSKLIHCSQLLCIQLHLVELIQGNLSKLIILVIGVGLNLVTLIELEPLYLVVQIDLHAVVCQGSSSCFGCWTCHFFFVLGSYMMAWPKANVCALPWPRMSWCKEDFPHLRHVGQEHGIEWSIPSLCGSPNHLGIKWFITTPSTPWGVKEQVQPMGRDNLLLYNISKRSPIDHMELSSQVLNTQPRLQRRIQPWAYCPAWTLLEAQAFPCAVGH